MSEKAVSLRVSAAMAAVACACAVAFGFGAGEALAEGPSGYAAVSAAQVSEQASASSSCALLRKDGNLWRCTSKGKPVSKYWSGRKTLSAQLGKVKTVFIASDVPSVSKSSYLWTRYTSSLGRVSDYRYSTPLASSYFKNLKTVKFLTNSSGASKCKVIGDEAFGYATSVAKVVNFNKTKVTRIGQRAFSRTNITGLSFPKTLKAIGKYAFYDCAKLKKVSGLNKTKLSTLGDDAFYSCKKLSGIALPSSCKVVAKYAFSDCVSLKSAKLGSKTTKVGDGAFYNCEKLASISLPATCKKLGYSVFSGCSSLNKVTMLSPSVVTHATNAVYGMTSQFYGTPIAVEGNGAYIYVPGTVLSQYASSSYTNPWYSYIAKFKAV